MTAKVYSGTEWARISLDQAGIDPEKLDGAKRWLDDHVGEGRYRIAIVRGG